MARARTPDTARDGTAVVSNPSTRTVASLDAAVSAFVRFGGSVASERRTAPGIGSWAFVVDREGRELVLWETAVQIG